MKVGKSRGLDKRIILWYGRKSMEEKRGGKDSKSIGRKFFFMIVDICVLMKTNIAIYNAWNFHG